MVHSYVMYYKSAPHGKFNEYRLVSLVFDVLSLGSLLIVLLHPHLYHILSYPILSYLIKLLY